MSQYRDPFPIQSGWIHELAKAEIHPEAERLLQLNRSYDPNQLIEESSIALLTELKDYFSEHIRLFNGYSEGGRKFCELKLYSLAQTPADFMIFRNQVKLVISNTGTGVIQFSFSNHAQPARAAVVNGAGAASTNSQVHEIMAHVGPFRDVSWTYQNEKVEAEQLARFFFTEFVRTTRNTDKSKTANDLLLKEIKTFLQQKGLEI